VGTCLRRFPPAKPRFTPAQNSEGDDRKSDQQPYSVSAEENHIDKVKTIKTVRLGYGGENQYSDQANQRPPKQSTGSCRISRDAGIEG